MSLLKSIITIGNYTILSRISSFLRDLLMATYIGAGPVADSLVIAIKIPSFFRRLFAEGAFNAAFVPLFSQILSKDGKKEAQTYAEEILSLIIIFLLGLIVIFEIFTPLFMDLLTPGFRATPERFELAILFSRITFPYLLLISLTALYSGILNSFERFVATSSSPFAGNIFICGVMLFARASKNSGDVFATALLFSGLVQLLWVLFPTHAQGIRLRFIWPRLTLRATQFFAKLLPGAIGTGVVQINIFLGLLIASFLPIGSVSYLYYADILNQFPTQIISIAIGIALLPLMTEQIINKDLKAANHTQNRAIEFGLFLAFPAAISLIIGAETFTSILFERGKFTLAISHQTALTLMAYACGIPAYILIKIFGVGFFARANTRTPFFIASFCVLLDVILCFLLFLPLHHIGIALATALISWINAFALGYSLKKHHLLIFDAHLKQFLPKLLLASACMGTVIYFINKKIHFWAYSCMYMEKLLALIILVGSGLFVFLGIIFLTKALNFKDLNIFPPKL